MSPNNRYMLGVDIGSSNLKCLIVRNDGELIASESRELKTLYQYPGWSEQDPDDWYTALADCCHKIFTTSGIGSIESVCITAATHTAVLLDENDKPLRPAIMWTDQRSIEESKILNDKYGQSILDIAYQKANPTWTLPQFYWLMRHERDVVEKTRKVMFAKDYLRFKLTGTWETDWIDALGSMMMDARTKEWSSELCDYIGWPLSTLPPICSPTTVVGSVLEEAARHTKIPVGIPVVAGASDTAAEDYGVGAINPGDGIIKLATAGNTNIMASEPSVDPLLFNYYHVIPGMWYTVAATSSCAAVHKWLRDEFFRVESDKFENSGSTVFAYMDNLAKSIPAGSNGLIFHPYLMGERTPHWDPLLKGDYLGISIRHKREHFIKALYEGISFSLLECYLSLEKRGLKMEQARLIGGGAKSELWRQTLSDVLGKETLIPEIDDASFGAALIGGVGCGLFSNERDAIDKCTRVKTVIRPNYENHARYQELFDIFTRSQQLLVEINHALHRFNQ
ncbi:xylulokinase [Desulfofustis glycolicus DSM 9705]|uniref:Xylulokinase n=2 Tax=Desulfofustis glycolicus TaxID=51195 RepID=A0A1M5S0R9_9BACT|nr:xylulokinase [Desulfofustis glycolicus DSM 9705]